MLLSIFVFLCVGNLYADAACNQRSTDQSSFVCVCDDSFCDFVPELPVLAAGEFARVISSRDEYRLDVFVGNSTDNSGSNTISIDPSVTYQTIKGFGGAFTDSTGINVNYLSESVRDAWVRSYFAPEGIQYDLCRVPIAGSDFSTRPYSYDDVYNDTELIYFNLTSEDYTLKLPYMRAALEVSDRDVLIFGSPWSPPAWMKENDAINGSGGLLPSMWNSYSNYLVKFIQAYEAEGVPIWGLTPVNEPLVGFQDWPWNALAFAAEDMRDWIIDSFGPILTAAGLRPRITFMVYDHNRDAIPSYPATVLDDSRAAQYVDGTAVHWYDDQNTGPEVLSELQSLHADKFILYTEACEGWDAAPTERVLQGDWQRAENYAANILEDLEHFSTGWVDWNMALDTSGGPNWADNFVDSPTLVQPGIDEFLKQPTFYAMGHFSKYLSPGSVRIQTVVSDGSPIQSSSYSRPEGDIAVVLLNTAETAEDVVLQIGETQRAQIVMQPKSMETLIFY